MTNQTRALYERAIAHFGEITQIVKAMEEAGELVQAVAKYLCMADLPMSDAEAEYAKRTKDHLAEEIADVRIMLDQLEMIADCHDQVDRWKWKKIKRLRERIEEDENGNR